MALNEKAIGKRVEELRMTKPAHYLKQRKYLTREKLSELLYIDIEGYEERIKGTTPFSIKSILRIARLYDVSPNYILFGGIEWQAYDIMLL